MFRVIWHFWHIWHGFFGLRCLLDICNGNYVVVVNWILTSLHALANERCTIRAHKACAALPGEAPRSATSLIQTLGAHHTPTAAHISMAAPGQALALAGVLQKALVVSFLSAWCTGERRHSRQAGSQQHRSQEQTHHGQADGSPLRLIHVYMPGVYLTGYIPTYYSAECGRLPMVSSLSSNGNGCRERSADPGSGIRVSRFRLAHR